MELIQNADDSLYLKSVKLGLRITYEAGTLRFDTNEVDFNKSDVDVVCSIGRSSKTSVEWRAELIGENGIGFKSIFKVSDEVFISSRHYSLMFANKSPLGRLVPTWAGFPKDKLPRWTLILLRSSTFTWNGFGKHHPRT